MESGTREPWRTSLRPQRDGWSCASREHGRADRDGVRGRECDHDDQPELGQWDRRVRGDTEPVRGSDPEHTTREQTERQCDEHGDAYQHRSLYQHRDAGLAPGEAEGLEQSDIATPRAYSGHE